MQISKFKLPERGTAKEDAQAQDTRRDATDGVRVSTDSICVDLCLFPLTDFSLGVSATVVDYQSDSVIVEVAPPHR